jgi:hypothetical protein
MENKLLSTHVLIIDYCWAAKRRRHSSANYETAKVLFADDPSTILAYKQYYDESKEEYRLARQSLFEYARIEVPV